MSCRADSGRLTPVESCEVTMSGGKNNGEVMATLLRILAELRSDGKKMDQRMEFIEARMQKMDENIRKTATILNDAAHALSEIDLRVRKLEKRRP